MTNLRASDIAGRRIREARTEHGWTVKQLAAQCAAAGADHITATVITNLETRRRASREITLDELLALAHVLGVPPLRLAVPINADEVLEVVPGTEKNSLEAVGWIAGDTPLHLLAEIRSLTEGGTERIIRWGDYGSVLNTIRQIGYAVATIAKADKDAAASPDGGEGAARVIALTADRLMHLAARMEAQGYDPPGLDAVADILKRRGLPATLAEWRESTAEPGGED